MSTTDYPLITTVTAADGRITFHRVKLSIEWQPSKDDHFEKDGPDGKGPLELTLVATICDPVNISLDPSNDPLYSEHPEGGWISPPYQKLLELESLKIEPEFHEHIHCKCHKTHKSRDVVFLEKFGHTENCPRRPRPPEIQQPTYQQPLIQDQAYDPSAPVIPGKTPMSPVDLQRYLDTGQLPTPGRKTPSVPVSILKGGMSDIQLEALAAGLDGASHGDQGIPLQVGLQDIGLNPANFDVSVVAGQLWREFSLSTCKNCGTWRKMDSSRVCGNCR